MVTVPNMIFVRAPIGFRSKGSGWRYPSGPLSAIVAIRSDRPWCGTCTIVAASSSAALCRQMPFELWVGGRTLKRRYRLRVSPELNSEGDFILLRQHPALGEVILILRN